MCKKLQKLQQNQLLSKDSKQNDRKTAPKSFEIITKKEEKAVKRLAFSKDNKNV